jgi:hypothetical protein
VWWEGGGITGWWELGHKGVEKGLDRKEVGKKEDFQGVRGEHIGNS